MWVGNQPKWVKKVVDQYRKVNPGYEVILHDKFESDPQLDRAFSKMDSISMAYPIAFKVDLYRCYLLYKYGGIYLDCDTIPIRPFDDNLINREYFFQLVSFSSAACIPSISFCGCQRGDPMWIEIIERNIQKLNEYNAIIQMYVFQHVKDIKKDKFIQNNIIRPIMKNWDNEDTFTGDNSDLLDGNYDKYLNNNHRHYVKMFSLKTWRTTPIIYYMK